MKEKLYVFGVKILILVLFGVFLWITSKLNLIQISVFLCVGYSIYFISQQKRWIIYSLAPILILFEVFLLGLAYLPLFETDPNIKNTINTNTRHIIVNSKGELSTVSIKQQGFTKNQEISENNKEIRIKESSLSKINFINKNTNSEAKMIIQFPNETILVVYPNSSFSLELSGSQQIFEKLSGQMEYTEGKGNDIIIKNAERKEMSDLFAEKILNISKEKERQMILENAGGAFMENENIRIIIHNLLNIAVKIRPKKYEMNIENENEYQRLLNRKETTKTNDTNDYKKNTINIMEASKNAGAKTKFLQFLSK